MSSGWCRGLVAATLVACASAPPPPPPATPAEEHEIVVDEPAPAPPATSVDTPERAAPPSTKTYEEALSTPESLDVHDDRVQLTDAQLTGPMRTVVGKCRMPTNAKVTIKTAVQNGRAIGVSVSVRFEHPKSNKPLSRAVVKAEAKASTKIATCFDRVVRTVVWPPSSRRDSFTTEL